MLINKIIAVLFIGWCVKQLFHLQIAIAIRLTPPLNRTNDLLLILMRIDFAVSDFLWELFMRCILQVLIEKPISP